MQIPVWKCRTTDEEMVFRANAWWVTITFLIVLFNITLWAVIGAVYGLLVIHHYVY